ncbi:hypothetical protein BLOT_011886 [Blomia tropicalis]|nr:hypothetical protein BLOT_011886 [Blomia tropicalis]
MSKEYYVCNSHCVRLFKIFYRRVETCNCCGIEKRASDMIQSVMPYPTDEMQHFCSIHCHNIKDKKNYKDEDINIVEECLYCKTKLTINGSLFCNLACQMDHELRQLSFDDGNDNDFTILWMIL